jgi:hypothetical protein
MARAGRLVCFSLPLLIVFCGRADLTEGLFLLALEALPQETFRGKEMQVSPRLLGESFPRLTAGALGRFRSEGYAVSGGDETGAGGTREEGMATVYFTPPDSVGLLRYEAVDTRESTVAELSRVLGSSRRTVSSPDASFTCLKPGPEE